jgi:hypothetical protein
MSLMKKENILNATTYHSDLNLFPSQNKTLQILRKETHVMLKKED